MVRLSPTLMGALITLASCSSPAPLQPMISSPPPSSNSTRAAVSQEANAPHPPIAKKERHTVSIHDRVLSDDYFWMQNKGSPDVVSYLEAENAYTSAMTKPLEPIAHRLYDEMLARM